MRVLDNLIALRILWLLVTPFENTQAFKLGLIDAEGNRIKKAKTTEESNATSMLHRLVWRIKKFINLVPGGSTKIGSIVAAYALVRESMSRDEYLPTEDMISESYSALDTNFDESLELEELFKELSEDAPANATGAAVSTDAPAIKKKLPKFTVAKTTAGNLPAGKTTVRRIGSLLHLKESGDIDLFGHIVLEESGTVILNDSKIVRFYCEDSVVRRPIDVLKGLGQQWSFEVIDID